MDTDLHVNLRRAGAISVLGVSGDIDTFTCMKLKEAIIDLIKLGDSRVVINMSGVNYIDSSGLGTLVGALRRVNLENGDLAISGASPHVLKVFNITGLNTIFNIFPDEDDAIRNLET